MFGGPFMRGVPMNAPMGPASTIDYEMAQDELNVSGLIYYVYLYIFCVNICMYIYVCVYVCKYIFIYMLIQIG